jgi:hypothetical protein
MLSGLLGAEKPNRHNRKTKQRERTMNKRKRKRWMRKK